MSHNSLTLEAARVEPSMSDAHELVEAARAKILRGEDLTDDEVREVILAARAGRRSAAEGTRKARSKPPTVSIDTLFRRQEPIGKQ
jgi:hypothetical protein